MKQSMNIKIIVIISIKFLVLATIITGILYPLCITITGRIIFPRNSSGSLIRQDDRIIGSELIGQQFTSPEYFWGRPSACDYNAVPASGSNLGPTNAELRKHVQEQMLKFGFSAQTDLKIVPSDLLFSSGSGVDPDISVKAALVQIPRIAAARKLSPKQQHELFQLIMRLKKDCQLFILGAERINVLQLNMETDQLFK
jgi:potassium-transporting ATPase KdpC subunit